MIVDSIYIYPVKSCQGMSLTEVEVVDTGFKFDRRWFVVSGLECGDPKVVAQYLGCQKLAAIAPEISRNPVTGQEVLTLCLSTDINKGSISVNIRNKPDPSRKVSSIFGNDAIVSFKGFKATEIEWEGSEVSLWLTSYLATGRSSDEIFHLVSFPPNYSRGLRLDPTFSPLNHIDDKAIMTETSQLLLHSISSLKAFNNSWNVTSELSREMNMNLFRPNIVISGAPPYAEDRWKVVRICSSNDSPQDSGLLLRTSMPAMRCSVTNIIQHGKQAGQRLPEVQTLKALKLLRKSLLSKKGREKGVFHSCMGIKLNMLKDESVLQKTRNPKVRGEKIIVRVGDDVTCLEKTPISLLSMNSLDEMRRHLLPNDWCKDSIFNEIRYYFEKLRRRSEVTVTLTRLYFFIISISIFCCT